MEQEQDLPVALVDGFLEALDPVRRGAFASWPLLGARLALALAEARSAWPGIELPAGVFLPFVARRVPEEQDPEAGLGRLAVTDLYLACACAAGDARAMTALEERYFGEVDRALAGVVGDSGLKEEVKQALREHLFVRAQGTVPGIDRYSGTGLLGRWLRITALRRAYRMTRGNERLRPLDEARDPLPLPAEDPELDHMKVKYRAEFDRAFRAAAARLSVRERNLLRHAYLDGLNVDQIGKLYQVHRATAARWVSRAREALVVHTRDALMRQLRIQSSEYESIMRMIRSRLEVSVRGAFGPVEPPDG